MKRKSWIVISAAAVAWSAWLGITVARGDGEYVWSNIQTLTITNNFGTPFLTISNRPHVMFEGGSCLVRVTDAEWNAITNHYADKIKTHPLIFYGKSTESRATPEERSK